ncbi:hypothetical protein ACMU_01685 [Actibacterium mucosum KCTC 23349]|uniref:Capsule polysaccharide biosynthesis protein n=1 Tax=Actibacterium mucosum KCTC 23349 TaxID=1454373 RepID=A0A037ZLA1_9RHOB|nr:hypothetical protein [Actibacterium mucosum]KAJ57231.1 hypothetical protein ACMU_01685 [Actibacterium mucosum KCTC 23349]
MSAPRHLTIHLHEQLRRQVQAGRHKFLGQLTDVVTAAGFTVEYAKDNTSRREETQLAPGYALFHMKPPLNDRTLSFRKTYLDPFWSIQKTDARWAFTSARMRFDSTKVDAGQATRFADKLRARHFATFDAVEDENFVYVPLQGKLTTHRNFQTDSPLNMLEATANQFRSKAVVATLHPREDYSPSERAALDDLIARHQNVFLTDKPAEQILPRCSLVVTQNSSLAFLGYFLAKPAVLFAAVDFHHIAANAGQLGVGAAFQAAIEVQPDFDAYLFWFLQRLSINVARQNGPERIHATLQKNGWPV